MATFDRRQHEARKRLEKYLDDPYLEEVTRLEFMEYLNYERRIRFHKSTDSEALTPRVWLEFTWIEGVMAAAWYGHDMFTPRYFIRKRRNLNEVGPVGQELGARSGQGLRAARGSHGQRPHGGARR